MIDFNDAGQQKEAVAGPIPKKSLVKVKLEIRKPKKADPQDPAVTIFKSKLKGLDCEFVVMGGQFEGVKIWENWFLPPSMQTIPLTKGQEGICNGSFAKARAVIESARGLDPSDPAVNRQINSWFDLHSLEFAVKVGIDKVKPGDLYINNNIAKVLTVADAGYKDVMAGGEVISDIPIPEIPAAPGGGSAAKGGGQEWGQQQNKEQQPPPEEPKEPPKQMNIPGWAQQ